MTSSSLILLAAFAFPSFSQILRPFEAVEPHMGTLFRIKLYASDEVAAQRAFRAAFDRIAQLDNILSDYKPGSELNRLSTTAVRHPVVVSDDLFRIVSTAQRLSQQTQGAFDITVGPLTHVWREARKLHRVPDPASVEKARARCGYQKLRLDSVHRTVEFDEPGMQLDAGAIAKGDAADQALTLIGRSGIESALAAASGDLAFSAPPPGEKGWKIGVDSLDSAQAPFNRVLLLAHAAVSTSGASEQHLDAAGIRYSHILNARTGSAITRDLTVSVVAPHGIEADSFATAVSVLGIERGMAFIERQNGASALVVTNEHGEARAVESSRFRLLPMSP